LEGIFDGSSEGIFDGSLEGILDGSLLGWQNPKAADSKAPNLPSLARTTSPLYVAVALPSPNSQQRPSATQESCEYNVFLRAAHLHSFTI
jgi:hypothetical protein